MKRFHAGRRVVASLFVESPPGLWKAADLTPLGSVPMSPSSGPLGAASDGVNFWIVLSGAGSGLARF